MIRFVESRKDKNGKVRFGQRKFLKGNQENKIK